jgi:hypothetical protein
MKASIVRPSRAALPERMTFPMVTPNEPAGSRFESDRQALRAVTAAAVVMLLVHLWVALNRGINWDEFHHFDMIRRFGAGTLEAPLQTFYIHLFKWLLDIPLEPTAQIRTGRLVMLASISISAVLLYGISTRFASRPAAALVALAWLTGGLVVEHGTAFRTDPLATVVLLAAAWLLARHKLTSGNAMVAGILVGLATVITIKSSLYAPVFAAIAWLHWQQGEREALFKAIVIACLAAIATFASLFSWHSAQLAPVPPGAGIAATKSALETVFSEGFLPRADAFFEQIRLAPHLTLLIGLAPFAWRSVGKRRYEIFVMIGLMLPLATVLLYRNAYPYFYVFILPPVLVATAPAIDLLLKRLSPAILAGSFLLIGLVIAANSPRGTIEGQRQTIAVAKQLFPQPVTYIDFAGSLGSQNRATDFMLSGWGLKNYHARGIPELRQIMLHKTVPLLVVNHPVLDAAMAGARPPERLMDADAAALRDNYIPHWGRLYVAGKVISPGGDPIEAEFLVPGPYTLEDAAIELDGRAYRPGDIITLSRGLHRIGGSRQAQATLRWGKNLPRPAEAPLPVPPFDGF